jgi:ZIP family zinc transporter
VGSILAFFYKGMDSRFLSGALGFSAGVMIYVSMIEIFFKARNAIAEELGEVNGYWYTTAAFFAGMVLISIIDKLVPTPENPHEPVNLEALESFEDMEVGDEIDSNNLMRMGLFSALAIAIHNFPEGIATFVSALQDPALGFSIAVAIAIHNIPEGVAVSVPIYYATKSRKQAFFYSFLSGLSEPVGALIGYLFLYRYLTGTVFGLLFAAVAGIMVFISLDELLPTAEKYGEHHIAIYGVVAGMVVMALSLLLFA